MPIMRPVQAVIACCLTTFLMGTVHAWSVLVADLEQRLGLGRTLVTAVYSIALVTLTLSVLLAVPLYSRVAPAVLVGLTTAAAGVGLLTASTGHISLILLGYGFVFGAANGIAYGYCLQLCARVLPRTPGFAMGITTAAYGFGAVTGAWVLGTTADVIGALASLQYQGLVFLCASALLAWLIWNSNARFDIAAEDSEFKPIARLDSRLIMRFRGGYGLAAAAGLMAIAHAGPFLATLDGATRDATVLGVTLLGVGNVVGGIVAGLLSERLSIWSLLVGIPLFSALALVVASLSTQITTGIAAMFTIGLCYGSVIALYPIAVAARFGTHNSPRAYGQIFLAWGAAGLLAPVLAGLLFEWSQSYTVALFIAATLSVISAGIAVRLAISTT